MAVVVITPPDYSPTLDELKVSLGVESNDKDDLIEGYRDAACAYLDGPNGILDRCIWTQTLELRTDAFEDEIELSHGPIQSIESVIYTASDGTETTVDEDEYQILSNGILTPIYGGSWPTPRGGAEDVKVQYVAGFETVPQRIHVAVRMLVAHFLSNQEAVSSTDLKELPLGVDALIAGFRTVKV